MTSIIRLVLARIFPTLRRLRRLYRRVRRPITVGVRALVVDESRVVLIRTHGSHSWDLPGGGVKRGETLRMAAQREAQEETGCQIEVGAVLGTYLNAKDRLSDHVTVFICRALNDPCIGLNIEIAQARWWSLDALPATLPPATQRRLAEYRTGKGHIEGYW